MRVKQSLPLSIGPNVGRLMIRVAYSDTLPSTELHSLDQSVRWWGREAGGEKKKRKNNNNKSVCVCVLHAKQWTQMWLQLIAPEIIKYLT